MTTQQEVVAAFHEAAGSVTQTARAVGLSRGTVYYHLKKAGIDIKSLADGTIDAMKVVKNGLPKKGEVRRYICTSAQNNTHIHETVWNNILALANHYSADILVGTFTYNQNKYGHMSVKRGTSKTPEKQLWYASDLMPFIRDERVELAPGLHWCGEMNILPTAVDPLTGFETYTGRSSGIFPHTKFTMRSIAGASKFSDAKFNYTTGAVTKRNYVQKRAGLKAEHHHGYGGLIIEVDHTGAWWVRQLNADNDGTIYDLDLVVESGVVYESDFVEAITWGDLHTLMVDHNVYAAAWGDGGMADNLKPKYQFLHDVMLGSVTNHWTAKNCHEKFRRHVKGEAWSDLTKELELCAKVLNTIATKSEHTVVVDSNHDRPWLERWLRETDGRFDPKNALLWLRLNTKVYEAIQKDPMSKDFHLLETALQDCDCSKSIRFLREDESYTITDGKIECGMHGHLGPDGTKGSPRSLFRLGHRANVAHFHSAGIWDGLYVAGTTCQLDLQYNSGPSSWSQSHIVTYPNGKRAIITVWDGRWRA